MPWVIVEAIAHDIARGSIRSMFTAVAARASAARPYAGKTEAVMLERGGLGAGNLTAMMGRTAPTDHRSQTTTASRRTRHRRRSLQKYFGGFATQGADLPDLARSLSPSLMPASLAAI